MAVVAVLLGGIAAGVSLRTQIPEVIAWGQTGESTEQDNGKIQFDGHEKDSAENSAMSMSTVRTFRFALQHLASTGRQSPYGCISLG